jgi:hypothetical protein
LLGGPLVAQVATWWRVEAVADFSNDGKADILWRYIDGTTGAWIMNGAAIAGVQFYPSAP